MHATIIVNLLLVFLLCRTAHADAYSSKAAGSKSIPPAPATSVPAQGRLARITAYWPGEDHFTNRKQSASGIRLCSGTCAVDSRIIPYGSLVTIPGLGTYVAVDTGTAVISRKAARESGRTRQERNALVVDLYFASRKAGEFFSREGPKFALIAWEPAPLSLASN